MIAGDCFTIEWQASKREELGGCDPVLLEKTIHAFALLDALAARGLQFIFKGGTSLLLRLPRIRRLSIDADITSQEPAEKLDPLLAEISRTPPFNGMAEDDRGEHRFPPGGTSGFLTRPSTRRIPRPSFCSTWCMSATCIHMSSACPGRPFHGANGGLPQMRPTKLASPLP
jgi:hypothetical protein